MTYQTAVDYIKNISPEPVRIAIILGSGLGGLADKLTDAVAIPYEDIPGFVSSTAPGHNGRLVIGTLGGKRVLCMQGRLHLYEGYPFGAITFPLRVFKLLGVQTLVVTNAAGGINTGYNVGDFMLITDHINLMGSNPMIGKNDDNFGLRFFDMGTAYTPALRELALRCAGELDLHLHQGVYIGVTGPSYETPAEIRAFRAWGADAVGMSTVPEVIAARHCGMDVLGLSLITNMAAGVLDEVLGHDEVMEIGQLKAKDMQRLVGEIIANIK